MLSQTRKDPGKITHTVLIIIGLMLTESAGTPANAQLSQACWSDKQLQAQPGEKSIRRLAGVPPPPSYVQMPYSADGRAKRGAIRRVELPPGSKKLIALTFDLCEQPNEVAGYDGELVDILRKEGVRATFFAGGKWMHTHEERAQQLMGDPLFEIGNHSWEHRNLRITPATTLKAEIEWPQQAYRQLRAKLEQRACLARQSPEPAYSFAPKSMELFRFPFGACSNASLDAVSNSGMLAVQWDVSSGDPWIGQTAERMVAAVLAHANPGSIVLFHANGRGWNTRKALIAIIAGLKSKHFEFVTVGELLTVPGARWDIRNTCFDVKPGDTDRYDTLARRLATEWDRSIPGVRLEPSAPQSTASPRASSATEPQPIPIVPVPRPVEAARPKAPSKPWFAPPWLLPSQEK